MERLRLDVRYSVRHLWQEKQRTVFALFCVAAGVAAIVTTERGDHRKLRGAAYAGRDACQTCLSSGRHGRLCSAADR